MRIAAVALSALFALPAAASAQETRTELLEKKRAEKAAKLEPYEPTRLEKFITDAEEGKLRRLISPHNGFFGEYGYTDKPVGSGIALGGGFRHDLFNRQARIELEGGISLRRYELLRADFSLPRIGDRVELGVQTTYRRHPQEDFYGPGAASIEDDRVNFLYKGTDVQGRAVVEAAPWLHVGVRAGRLAPTIGTGTDSRYPSIEARFGDADAPGLVAQPDFTYGEGFAEVDYRDEPGNARDGGHYVISWRAWSDRDLQTYSFRATNVLVQQFVPIFDKKRVFAFQLGAVATSTADGQQVPFYMQPTVGGSRTLRSVSEYRFRDANALWMNAEYRWEAFGLLDMALFTDWGKVAPKASDLTLSGLEKAYGIGFRFNTSSAVFFRFDIATGAGEGLHYYFKFSKAF